MHNQNEAKSGYLLASNDRAGFTLDDHIFSATNVQSSRSKCSRLIKIIHDPSYFFRFELNEQTSIHHHYYNITNKNRSTKTETDLQQLYSTIRFV